MLKMFMTFSMIFISMMMLLVNQPLILGFLILIQTLMLCLSIGLLSFTYWFSYILFLTFSGGLMVLFIYVSSIASNEIFKFPKLNKIFMFIFIMFMLILYMYMNWNNLLNFNIFSNNEMIFYMSMFNSNNLNMNMIKMYNQQTFMIMLIMIIYLFITMVSIVKITNIYFGPLRSLN